MAKIYSNENFPLPCVEALRHLGHDVLTTTDAGQDNQSIPDDEVLEFATQDDRILVTLNRKHFIKLHREIQAHAGIVVCTYDPDFEALAQRIHDVIEQQESMSGVLLRVNRPPSDTLI